MKGMNLNMRTTMRKTNYRISQSSRQTIAPVGAIIICAIARSIRCSWSSIVSSLINHAKIHMKTKISVLKAGTQDTKYPSTHTSEGVSYRQYNVKYVNCA